MEAKIKPQGNYLISDKGEVYSNISKRYLKPGLANGYHHVVLCNDGVQKKYLVHRLVASLFIPNPENKPCVNHKNGVRNDNRVENLEWVTYSENEIHSRTVLGKRTIHSDETKEKIRQKAKGRDMTIPAMASALKNRGKAALNSIKVIYNDTEIFPNIREAAKAKGICMASISNIVNGKTTKTKLGKWEIYTEN